MSTCVETLQLEALVPNIHMHYLGQKLTQRRRPRPSWKRVGERQAEEARQRR